MHILMLSDDILQRKKLRDVQGKLEQQIISTKCRKKGTIIRRIWGNKVKM